MYTRSYMPLSPFAVSSFRAIFLDRPKPPHSRRNDNLVLLLNLVFVI